MFQNFCSLIPSILKRRHECGNFYNDSVTNNVNFCINEGPPIKRPRYPIGLPNQRLDNLILNRTAKKNQLGQPFEQEYRTENCPSSHFSQLYESFYENNRGNTGSSPTEVPASEPDNRCNTPNADCDLNFSNDEDPLLCTVIPKPSKGFLSSTTNFPQRQTFKHSVKFQDKCSSPIEINVSSNEIQHSTDTLNDHKSFLIFKEHLNLMSLSDQCGSSSEGNSENFDEKSENLWSKMQISQKLPYYWLAIKQSQPSVIPFANFRKFYENSDQIKLSTQKLRNKWNNMDYNQRLPFILESFLAKITEDGVDSLNETDMRTYFQEHRRKVPKKRL